MVRWAGLSASSVYGCTRRLGASGFVVAEVPAENLGRGPAGRRYQITADGSKQLQTLAIDAISDSEASPARVRIGLAAAHHLERMRLRQALSTRVAKLQDRLRVVKRTQRAQEIDHAPLGAQILFADTLAALRDEAKRMRNLERRVS